MNIEKINYKNNEEVSDLKNFLSKNHLNFDESCDYSCVIKDSKDNIVATVSKTKDILKCFAISDSLRGEGVASTLVTHILNIMFQEGYFSSFVFTKLENLELFKNIGYKEVASTNKVSLLEIGTNSIEKAMSNIKKEFNLSSEVKRSMLVMNCNPFTLGHKYLVEYAAKNSVEVILFVVQEDKSIFPFNVRYELVKKGCSHLKNVVVVPGTKYIISSATFPNYFLKKDDDALDEYQKLDVTVSALRICPIFNIKKRYIGDEPLCKMTSKYNNNILNIFPKFGIDVEVVPRKNSFDFPISATEVRKKIAQGDFESLKSLVPETTYNYLISNEAIPILEKISIQGDNKNE